AQRDAVTPAVDPCVTGIDSFPKTAPCPRRRRSFTGGSLAKVTGIGRTAALVTLVVTATGCGGGSSTSPSPAPVVPPPAPVTFSGHLTATNGAQPLAGVAVDLAGIKTTTAADGSFSYQFQPGTTSRLSFSSDTIVPRSLVFGVSQTRT